MNDQLTLRDAVAGAALKEAGMDRIEATGNPFIDTMRGVAREISDRSGHVTSDNLRIFASEMGLEPHHPNVFGVIFRGSHWKAIGRQRSAWPSNHHRFITVWEYVP